MTKMIFLSPHSDDVALSCGGAIQKNAGEWNVSILTIFSRSRYTHSQSLANDPETVTAARMREDQDFCNSIGASYHHLGYCEGNLRGYPDLQSLYQKENGADDPDYERVRQSVVESVFDDPEAIICSPIGIGQHIEHLMTVEIALYLERQGRELHFYEDLPYAVGLTMDEISEFVSKKLGNRIPEYIDITDTLPRKLQALEIYQSQINESLLEDIAAQSGRYLAGDQFRFERIWK